jgi:hypothetical protein
MFLRNNAKMHGASLFRVGYSTGNSDTVTFQSTTMLYNVGISGLYLQGMILYLTQLTIAYGGYNQG